MVSFMVVLLLATFVLYSPSSIRLARPGGLALLLAAVGLTELGTLAGEVTSGLRSRALASLIIAPLAIPLVIGGSQTLESLARDTSILPWMLLPVATDLALAVAGGARPDPSRRLRDETSPHSDGRRGCGVGGPLSRSPSPTDRLQGEFTRIVNIHAPSMWVAFLAFGVTALASILWLVRKTDRWDRIAEASVETGVLFTATGLFTGMVWGQAVWGRAWDWADPRMASTAVMFFVYIGYLALRRATPDPVMRARRSAILGAIAVVQSAAGVLLSQPVPFPTPERSRSGPTVPRCRTRW